MTLNMINRTREKIIGPYRSTFRKIFKQARQFLDLSSDTCVSVIFVKDEAMHKINRDYRNVDRTTDVISFALQDNQDEDDFIAEELGDIFINIDAVRRQAEEYGHSEEREICFLFTHGLCHLCGYDHMEPSDEREMIEVQKEILDEIVPPGK